MLGITSPTIFQSRVYLEDPPRHPKWLINMVIVSPLARVVGPLTNGLFMAYEWGLLTTY